VAEIALECRPLALTDSALAAWPDERLGALAAAGDDRAFALLYDRYERPLRGYCRRILGGDGDVDDVMQTTVARALAGLHLRRPGGSWRAWLFRIAHNEAIEVLRRRRPTAQLDAAEGVAIWPIELRMEQRERLDTLVSDLKDLPERQRSALVMRELSGLEHDEIGDALAMTPGAARQAIFEARSALHDFEAGRGMACDDVRVAVSAGDGRRLRERRLRAHLRACPGCRAFRDSGRRRRAAFLPSVPFLSGLLHRLHLSGMSESAVTTKALAAAAALSVSVGLAGGVPHLTPIHHSGHGATASRPSAPGLLAPHHAQGGLASTAAARPLSATPPVAPRRHRARAAVPRAPRTPVPVVARRPDAAALDPFHQSITAAAAAPAAATQDSTAPAPSATPAAADPRPGKGGTPPGQGGTPPGQAGTPPGQGGTPPGLDGTTPPGQGGTPPGQAKKDSADSFMPPGQAGTPPGQAKKLSTDDGTPPPGQDQVPPGQAKADAKPAKDESKPEKGKRPIDPDATASEPS
jgi:RNA polymerase sigma factor (sigma-70 family)